MEKKKAIIVKLCKSYKSAKANEIKLKNYLMKNENRDK